MIEKHLRKIAAEMVFKDSDEHMMTNYLEMTKEPGWKTHKAVLVAIFQGLGNDLLSSGFTNKSAEEKDVIQKVYYELSEIIKFLLNPLEEAKASIRIATHNRRMSEFNNRKEKKSNG